MEFEAKYTITTEEFLVRAEKEIYNKKRYASKFFFLQSNMSGVVFTARYSSCKEVLLGYEIISLGEVANFYIFFEKNVFSEINKIWNSFNLPEIKIETEHQDYVVLRKDSFKSLVYLDIFVTIFQSLNVFGNDIFEKIEEKYREKYPGAGQLYKTLMSDTSKIEGIRDEDIVPPESKSSYSSVGLMSLFKRNGSLFS